MSDPHLSAGFYDPARYDEAADRLAALDALRVKVPCRTCGGTGKVKLRGQIDPKSTYHSPCPNPDCEDGQERLTWQAMANLVAELYRLAPTGPLTAELLDHLRSIR